MTVKNLPKEVRAGLTALREAVREELKRKAKLGQYAIVSINGKTRRVKAETLLRRGRKTQGKASSAISQNP